MGESRARAGALYRGARLAAAQDWAARHRHKLSRVERDFLATSEDTERGELEASLRAARRLRRLATGLCILAAGIATLAAWPGAGFGGPAAGQCRAIRSARHHFPGARVLRGHRSPQPPRHFAAARARGQPREPESRGPQRRRRGAHRCPRSGSSRDHAWPHRHSQQRRVRSAR